MDISTHKNTPFLCNYIRGGDVVLKDSPYICPHCLHTVSNRPYFHKHKLYTSRKPLCYLNCAPNTPTLPNMRPCCPKYPYTTTTTSPIPPYYNTFISLRLSKPPPPLPRPPLQYPESIFLKVIGDSSSSASSLMKRESVRTVPAFHFFKDGVKVDVVNGANADALEQAIKKHT